MDILTFFTKAPMINVLQWKQRCGEALELSGQKILEDGGNITK